MDDIAVLTVQHSRRARDKTKTRTCISTQWPTISIGQEALRGAAHHQRDEFRAGPTTANLRRRPRRRGAGDYLAAYEKLASEGIPDDQHPHECPKISGAYQAASVAKQMLEEPPPERAGGSHPFAKGPCQGWMAIQAVRAAITGINLDSHHGDHQEDGADLTHDPDSGHARIPVYGRAHRPCPEPAREHTQHQAADRAGGR